MWTCSEWVDMQFFLQGFFGFTSYYCFFGWWFCKLNSSNEDFLTYFVPLAIASRTGPPSGRGNPVLGSWTWTGLYFSYFSSGRANCKITLRGSCVGLSKRFCCCLFILSIALILNRSTWHHFLLVPLTLISSTVNNSIISKVCHASPIVLHLNLFGKWRRFYCVRSQFPSFNM